MPIVTVDQIESPTTELDAVNVMLSDVGATPVNTLDGPMAPDVLNARNTLQRISKTVQGEGWAFNTEENYPLNRNEDSEIHLPLNTHWVQVQRPRGVDAVRRGQRLYDRRNHTYTFEADLKAHIVFVLPFEELPEPHREYIYVRASRVFVTGVRGPTADTRGRFNEVDEARARADMMRSERLGNVLSGVGTYRPWQVLRSDN